MAPSGHMVRFCLLWMMLICPRRIESSDVNNLLPEADDEASEYLPLPDSNDHGLLNSYTNIDEDIDQSELYQSDDSAQEFPEIAAKAFPDESFLVLDHADSITSDGKKEREVDEIWKPDSNSKQSEEDMLKTLLVEYDDTKQKTYSSNKISTVPDDVALQVQLPGVSVKKDDTYLCTSVRIDDVVKERGKPIYIKKYIPHAKQTVAHHMLLYGCQHPGMKSPGSVWDCSGLMGAAKSRYPAGNVCGSGYSTILWAWAKDAPAFSLPKGIGFKVGDTTQVQYLTLQVHYKSASVFKDGKKDYSSVTVIASKKQMPRIAGVYVLATSMGSVAPHSTKNFDIYCRYRRTFPIHPFAFRTHTHALGTEVLGYRIRNAKWTLIGKKNPQLPQEFYAVSNNMTIRNGDVLAARCVMHNFRNVRTSIGYRHTDEMCNFYIMFWTDKRNEDKLDRWIKSCDNGYPWIHWSTLPGFNQRWSVTKYFYFVKYLK